MTRRPGTTHGTDENAYRAHFLREDGVRLAWLCAAGIVFNCVLIALDLSTVRGKWLLQAVLAARCVYVVFSAFTIAIVLRTNSVRRYDAVAFGWGISTAALVGIVIFARPFDYTANVVPDLAIALLLYLFMPSRGAWRAVPGALLSIVHVGSDLALKAPLAQGVMLSTAVAFVLVNLLGWVAGDSMIRSRRRYWLQFVQAEALARRHLELVSEKERLLATLSHESRTPFNAISSSATLLCDYFERLDETQRADVAGRLRAGVARLAHLCDEVLRSGRETGSRLARNPMRVDLLPWLRELGEEIRLLHEGCSVRVRTRGSKRRTVDPVLTRLIVSNLASNACKFAPGDARRELALDFDEHRLFISMSDTGPGIPPEEHERVFDPLYRGRDARLIEGSGMGLAIVRDAVSLLGGTVALASSPGVETRFDVTLPWLEDKLG